MKNLLIALCIGLLAIHNAHADALENTKDVSELAQKAMDQVAKGNVRGLYEVFAHHWPLSKGEIQTNILQSLRQRRIVQKRFGKTIGVEFFKEQNVANTLLQITYMEKFERHVIRWVFVFYKPEDEWFVNTISWDDTIQKLFDVP